MNNTVRDLREVELTRPLIRNALDNSTSADRKERERERERESEVGRFRRVAPSISVEGGRGPLSCISKAGIVSAPEENIPRVIPNKMSNFEVFFFFFFTFFPQIYFPSFV